MINPRLRHLPGIKGAASRPTSEHSVELRSSAGINCAETDFAKELTEVFGSDVFTESLTINPAKITEEVQNSPMTAAHLCHQACVLLGRGHHRRLHQYIGIAYTIACGMRTNSRQIQKLADYVVDGRTRSKVMAEKVQAQLLHYLFIYIFCQSGLTTRNRATQYAQGLQPFFDSNTAPADVERNISKYGLERLRRAAIKQASLVRVTEEWMARGDAPTSGTIEEVLATILEEEADGHSSDAKDLEFDNSLYSPPNGRKPDGTDGNESAKADRSEVGSDTLRVPNISKFKSFDRSAVELNMRSLGPRR